MSDNWERNHPRVNADLELVRSLLDESVGPISKIALSPLGGLVNSNYCVSTDRGNYFLRIVTGDPIGAEREITLLPHLPKEIPVPLTLATTVWEEYPVVVQSWIEGVTLARALADANVASAEKLGRAVGSTLGYLRNAEYPVHGFLDACGNIDQPFQLKPNDYLAYLDASLKKARPTLGGDLADACWHYIQANAMCMDSLPDEAHLCHGDFHYNNILVSETDGEWRVNGIIDWDSALSWHSLHDLAFLVRRPIPFQEHFEPGLLDGYRERGGVIPENWPVLRNLLQLLAWVDKLANNEHRPNVICTAQKCISTIVMPA
jgi:Ser/Thr protein kinase RdoA (MazF antagonist)